MKFKKLKIVQFLEYAAVIACSAPFYLLPHRTALRAGELLGMLVYRLLPSRREIGRKQFFQSSDIFLQQLRISRNNDEPEPAIRLNAAFLCAALL